MFFVIKVSFIIPHNASFCRELFSLNSIVSARSCCRSVWCSVYHFSYHCGTKFHCLKSHAHYANRLFITSRVSNSALTRTDFHTSNLIWFIFFSYLQIIFYHTSTHIYHTIRLHTCDKKILCLFFCYKICKNMKVSKSRSFLFLVYEFN